MTTKEIMKNTPVCVCCVAYLVLVSGIFLLIGLIMVYIMRGMSSPFQHQLGYANLVSGIKTLPFMILLKRIFFK